MSGHWAGAVAWPPLLIALAFIGGLVVTFIALTAATLVVLWGADRLKRGPQQIRILVGTEAPFDFFKLKMHFRNHLIRICIENTSRYKKLSNCELKLDAISGILAHMCPVTIKSGFTLNPRSKEYINLVDCDEPITGPPASDPPSIHAWFPINPLSDGQSWLDGQSSILSLSASAAESAPDAKRVRVTFSDNKLKIEQI